MDTAVRFPTTPKAVSAKRLKLKRRMTVEDAFGVIIRNCIEHVQANDMGVARFHDVECLHQMRVGLRRMRSALAIFDDMLSLPPALQADLDWLVAVLGPARDWDVLVESTLAEVEGVPDAPPLLGELKQAALDRTHELHAAAGAAVGAERYARFMQALESWVGRRGWREMLMPGDKAKLKMPVAAFAATILDKDQRRLLKRGHKLNGADAEARHRVRIAAKKARYAAEFFGSLYRDREVRPYVKVLSRLQDALGRMNDAAVAQALLGELGVGDAKLDDGAAFVRGYLAARTVLGDASLRKRWKNFTAVKPPRC